MGTPRVTLKDRLKRFFYNSTELPKYTTGDAERRNCYLPEKLDALKDVLTSDNPDLLLNVIEMVNSENLLARRETIFVALAYAATTTLPIPDNFRHKVYTTLLNVCRTDKDLFTFIKFYRKQKANFSSGLNKAAFAYYARKDPMVLARDIARQKRYHGWSHKDVIKLAHGKTDSALTNLVLRYILFGLKDAKEFGENITDSEGILTFLTKAQTLRQCENVNHFPQLIADVEASLAHVPSYYHKTEVVWDSLIPYLDIHFVIQKLPLLFKYELLKVNSPIHNKIIQKLNNAEFVKSSHIYPIEIFIGLRNYERGGKPIDPQHAKYLKSKEATSGDKSGTDLQQQEKKKLLPKSPAIVSAINKALQLSYSNIKPTGKRFLITIEVSDKMQKPCLKTKNVTCLEAALSMTLFFFKIEKEVNIAVFNDNHISVVHLDKGSTINQASLKVQQVSNGNVYIPAIFDWCTKKKKNVEVFLNFIYYNHSLELASKEIRKERPITAFNKYKKNKNLPHAKMITFSLSSPNLFLADGTPNVLDICGFDKEIPKVVEAFIKGYFV